MTLATTVLVTMMTVLVVHVECADLSNRRAIWGIVCACAHMCVSSVCGLCVKHEDGHEVHRSNK